LGNITRTPRARQHALDIWLHIAIDSPKAADRFIDRIDDILQMLADNPFAGKAAPNLDKTVRYFPVGSYLVFYDPLPDGIFVLRLWHGAQDLDNLEF